MQRRNAIGIAGVIAVTAASAVLALGANLGIFGLTRESGPGTFQLIDRTPGAGSAPAPTPTTTATPSTVPASAEPVSPPRVTAGTTRPGGPGVAVAPTGGSPAAPPVAPTTPTTKPPSEDTRPGPGQDD